MITIKNPTHNIWNQSILELTICRHWQCLPRLPSTSTWIPLMVILISKNGSNCREMLVDPTLHILKKEKITHLHKLTACMDPLIHLLDLTSRSTPSTISSNFNFQIQSIDTTD